MQDLKPCKTSKAGSSFRMVTENENFTEQFLSFWDYCVSSIFQISETTENMWNLQAKLSTCQYILSRRFDGNTQKYANNHSIRSLVTENYGLLSITVCFIYLQSLYHTIYQDDYFPCWILAM